MIYILCNAPFFVVDILQISTSTMLVMLPFTIHCHVL